ncbi:MAG: Fic family protein [Muribaculaceae bacterium]|nr:Fic family protein [Muribaculaceae bacterium]
MSDEQKHTIQDFDEYIRQGEPDKKEKAYIWQTAIGLQEVDGLSTSNYLKETAKRNIEGEISIDEVGQLVKSYYLSRTQREHDAEKEEADLTAANISKILSVRTLDFSTHGYISLHRRIFNGVFKHAGKIRNYDITKKEWVLNGDTVNYLNNEDLLRALDYDIGQERQFSYKGLSSDEIIAHITRFVSGLWQIHAFGEGNTRTTAVFTIQYLRSIGFDINNDLFAKHSWYFRNALVRANYKNARVGIDYTPIYLERFFRNLLLGEEWDLRNRFLHIQALEGWKEQHRLNERTSSGQVRDKFGTSSSENRNQFDTDNHNTQQLVLTIGESQMSVKDMMKTLSLRGRDNFLKLYLNPAIEEEFVRLLHPNSPRHPRQKYLLTVKGLTLYNELLQDKTR